MKKLLMAAIAVFMMAGTSIASENVVVVENNVTTTVPENAIDKLITIIKLYAQRFKDADSLDKLTSLAATFEREMVEAEEAYGAEIAALEETLSRKQIKKYEAELEKVLAEIEAVVQKKIKEFDK